MTKIVILKTLKRDFLQTTQLVWILNTVLESGKRALYVETSLGAKFQISKSRNLIGQKFLKVFFSIFLKIFLKYNGYLRFSLVRMISEISLTWITLTLIVKFLF